MKCISAACQVTDDRAKYGVVPVRVVQGKKTILHVNESNVKISATENLKGLVRDRALGLPGYSGLKSRQYAEMVAGLGYGGDDYHRQS